MADKIELLKGLANLKGIAAEGTKAYQRSVEFLYRGLVGTYLWWREAKKIDGFLDELYRDNNLPADTEAATEKFTRLLRVIWQLDWTPKNSAKLQQWSLVLRELDKEYTNNKAAYKTGAEQKLINVIEDAGGIRKYIGADKYAVADQIALQRGKKGNRKTRQEILNDAQIRDRHIELGKGYFANQARSILNIESQAPITTTADGYTLALLRKSPSAKSKYAVLATLSDTRLIDETIIASYKESKVGIPHAIRLLIEIVSTQSIPTSMEAHRKAMQSILVTSDANKQNFDGHKISEFCFVSRGKTFCSVRAVANAVSSLSSSRRPFPSKLSPTRSFGSTTIPL